MDDALFLTDPRALVDARIFAHHACQWPSKAARANLDAAADDSHSNLGWRQSRAALLCHPLDAAERYRLGFAFAEQSLVWLDGDSVAAQLRLGGSTDSVDEWVDARLLEVGLRPLSGVAMPYQLEQAAAFERVDEVASAVEALGLWYAFAQQLLDGAAARLRDEAVAPVSVRCWPHHFDIALLALLEDGDPETARSIGIGLSPGDDSYAEPYFYCTPWPVPGEAHRGDPVAPFEWHTEGFVSLVSRVGALREVGEPDALMAQIIDVARRSLSEPAE